MKGFGWNKGPWRRLGTRFKGRGAACPWQRASAGAGRITKGSGLPSSPLSRGTPPNRRRAGEIRIESVGGGARLETGATSEPYENHDAVNVMDSEVTNMETGSVSKVQTTGRGRYSNTAAATPVRTEGAGTGDKTAPVARRAGRDLQSGLELLDLDFLLGVVENIDANNEQDIVMRKLSFNELVRTNRIHEIDSNALKVYAVDAEAHFGKEIQVEAFKELAERTATNAGK